MSVVALNSTAVRVTWTPVHLTIVEHYTVYYAAVDEKRSQCDRGSVNVTAGSSSGVVDGLMTGEEYQFGVSVTVSDNDGRSYTGPVDNSTDSLTVAVNPSTAG